jgi:hypothetical protein
MKTGLLDTLSRFGPPCVTGAGDHGVQGLDNQRSHSDGRPLSAGVAGKSCQKLGNTVGAAGIAHQPRGGSAQAGQLFHEKRAASVILRL